MAWNEPQTTFIHQLSEVDREEVMRALYREGLEHDQINDAMEGRLSDIEHIVGTLTEIQQANHIEDGGHLCSCADCGSLAMAVEDTDGEEWALCGNCGLTTRGFEPEDLPEFIGGEGTNYDYQFHLRHFGEHHTPDAEAVLACLRAEVENPFNGCPTCQELRGSDCRINSLDEMAHPDIKTQCVECVEIELSEDDEDDEDGYTQDDINNAAFELREFAVASCGCVDDGIINAMFEIIALGKQALEPTRGEEE